MNMVFENHRKTQACISFISRCAISCSWLLGVLVGALVLVSFANAAEPSAEQPKTRPGPPPTIGDMAYGPHERHRLDIWQADSAKPTPLLIFIHGGGWHGGDKSQVPLGLLKAMLAQGISVASINYRFTSMARLPGPLADAALSVQFLRSKSGELNLNSDSFGALGISAGGCSVLWVAYHDDFADLKSSDPVARSSSRLKVAVAESAQTSLEPEIIRDWIGDEVLKHGMLRRAVGVRTASELLARSKEFAALLRECSPINHVSADDPAVMLTYPRVTELPAKTQGEAIHHAIFGFKLKDKCIEVSAPVILRIDDQVSQNVPTTEAFLIDNLKRP